MSCTSTSWLPHKMYYVHYLSQTVRLLFCMNVDPCFPTLWIYSRSWKQSWCQHLNAANWNYFKVKTNRCMEWIFLSGKIKYNRAGPYVDAGFVAFNHDTHWHRWEWIQYGWGQGNTPSSFTKPDNQVRGGQHEAQLGPVGPILAPWILLSGVNFT